MTKTGWIALTLAIAGCNATVPPDKRPSDGATAPTPSTPVASQADVRGHWDVVSFEGYRPPRLSGNVRAAFADFSATGVSLRIECNYSGAQGTIKNGRFVGMPNQEMAMTLMGCAPDRSARDDRYFMFFRQSPSVERLSDGRLRLLVGKTELILERPDVRGLSNLPTAKELQGKWQMMQLQQTLPEGGYSGIGLSEIKGRVIISADQVIFAPCPQFALTYRLSAQGQLVKTGGTAPTGPKDCRALDRPRQAPTLPHEPEALRVLHANPMIEKLAPDQLLLSAAKNSLFLVRSR